ncbi:MAG: hypothetical protein H6707_03595 [Deltaproteobacteria bacterium]|nr:hypothetical protein [Deltaproteobacteria bacterium]
MFRPFRARCGSSLKSAIISCGLLSLSCAHKQATAPAKLPSFGDAVDRKDTAAVLEQAKINPQAIRCNTRTYWVPRLGEYSEAAAAQIAAQWGLSLDKQTRKKGARVVLGYLVRAVYEQLQPQNFGAMIIANRHYTDKDGTTRPLVVFRSGVTFDLQQERSCLRSLLEQGGVRHVINLYGGHFPLRDLIEKERSLTEQHGATHYDDFGQFQWRGLIKNEDGYKQNRDRAMRRVAELINSQIISPGGKQPSGNIYLHCGGGMHRTGMIFGVIKRCLNKAPFEAVAAEYRRHTGYQIGKASGFEPLNLRFIREFDCSLITRQPATAR